MPRKPKSAPISETDAEIPVKLERSIRRKLVAEVPPETVPAQGAIAGGMPVEEPPPKSTRKPRKTLADKELEVTKAAAKALELKQRADVRRAELEAKRLAREQERLRKISQLQQLQQLQDLQRFEAAKSKAVTFDDDEFERRVRSVLERYVSSDDEDGVASIERQKIPVLVKTADQPPVTAPPPVAQPVEVVPSTPQKAPGGLPPNRRALLRSFGF